MSKYKSNKKWIIGTVAVVAALVGAAVAVGAYLKKHSAFLNETLDYDDELFYEDDEFEYDTVADQPQESFNEELLEQDLLDADDETIK